MSRVASTDPSRVLRSGGRRRLVLEHTVTRNDPSVALACLACHSDLSKQKLRDAMNKGAVWLTSPDRKPQRLRRVTAPLKPGERLALYYDSEVLASKPIAPTLLRDDKRYSVWFKPAGLLVDGSRYGDHCTLERQVVQHFGNREVFLVHRLDRETAGVILVAHSSQAAARLGALFRNHAIEKEYALEVRGRLGAPGDTGHIDSSLDGKSSRTDYEVSDFDATRNVSRLRVSMRTGRYHQIRRHFAGIGHPVMGDPKYGEGNVDPRGMQLVASLLAFECPWTGEPVRLSIDMLDSH